MFSLKIRTNRLQLWRQPQFVFHWNLFPFLSERCLEKMPTLLWSSRHFDLQVFLLMVSSSISGRGSGLCNCPLDSWRRWSWQVLLGIAVKQCFYLPILDVHWVWGSFSALIALRSPWAEIAAAFDFTIFTWSSYKIPRARERRTKRF